MNDAFTRLLFELDSQQDVDIAIMMRGIRPSFALDFVASKIHSTPSAGSAFSASSGVAFTRQELARVLESSYGLKTPVHWSKHCVNGQGDPAAFEIEGQIYAHPEIPIY